jgi:hypothetical protein
MDPPMSGDPRRGYQILMMNPPPQRAASPLVRVPLRTLLLGALVVGASLHIKGEAFVVMIAKLLGS